MEGGLKKGFATLEKHARKRRTALEDRLQHEVLNDAEDAWLDDIDDDAERTTLSDTYACKLEKLLATFGRQTQLEATNAMLDTSITDFFTRTRTIHVDVVGLKAGWA
ncbi:hypothetical protein DFH07DRAFT_958367 [Mycena maculata]|uniref:Uncharacterized protein n=1 Tax=Mycena maculata TaxID=230809 RepID=A0AAD7NF89_9AGAR|nr:hypothetical protein DFH07DRAFT_958367 [Mycena maculata]